MPWSWNEWPRSDLRRDRGQGPPRGSPKPPTRRQGAGGGAPRPRTSETIPWDHVVAVRRGILLGPDAKGWRGKERETVVPRSMREDERDTESARPVPGRSRVGASPPAPRGPAPGREVLSRDRPEIQACCPGQRLLGTSARPEADGGRRNEASQGGIPALPSRATCSGQDEASGSTRRARHAANWPRRETAETFPVHSRHQPPSLRRLRAG